MKQSIDVLYLVCFAVGISVQFAKPQRDIRAQTYTATENSSAPCLHSFEGIVSQFAIFSIQIEIGQAVDVDAVFTVAIEFAVKTNEGGQM